MEANDKGKRANKLGRPKGTVKGVTPSATIRVSQPIAEMIRQRYNDATPKLKEWIDRLPWKD